jgi:outer membrane protein assembly factor BamE
MIKPIISLTLSAALLLGGCSSYKMEIQQGNYITSEELALVKPGMSAPDVQATLGTPLLVDDFHRNRWDYVFYLKAPDGTVQRSSVTVFFQNGIVSNIRNDSAPVTVTPK